jgi:hypothetical protein
MTSQMNLTSGQQITRNDGVTFTFRQFWFSNVTKQTYAISYRNGAKYNIPTTEIRTGA